MPSEAHDRNPIQRNLTQHTRYLAACGLVYLVVCGAAVRGFSTPWVMWAFILLLSLPIAWLLASFSAAKREHDLSIMHHASWLRRLLGGSTFRVVIAILIGLVIAFFLVSRLTVFTALDATLLLFAIPLLAILNYQFSKLSESTIIARQRARITVSLASLVTVFVLAILNVAAVLLKPALADPLTSNTLWSEAGLWRIPEAELSAGYALISEYAHAWKTMESWAEFRAADRSPLLRMTLSLLFEISSYGGIIALYAFFLLPRSERQRAILPSEVYAGSRPLRVTEIAMASATLVFLVVFVYFPIVDEYEGYAASKAARDLQNNVAARLPSDHRSPAPLPDISNSPTFTRNDGAFPALEEEPSTEITVDRDVEKIGEKYYAPGTAKALIAASSKIAILTAEAKAEASVVVSRSFDKIRAKGVPEFLNWYYSLTGDWVRTAATLRGSGEELLAKKLEEALAQTDNLSDQLAEVANRYDAHINAVHSRFPNILQKNLVTLAPEERPNEIATYDSGIISISATDTGFITNLKQRVSGAAAGTAVGGLIAANVARKVAAKGALKVAAKAVTRAAASRGLGGGGGAAGGALAGGAAGSVVPGVGTAIGAAIGGIVGGLAGGIAVDYVVLEIEEYFGREEFEAEILKAVNKVEAETIANLGL